MDDLVEIAQSGDRLKTLLEIRRKLADELRSSEGRDAATLAKELRAVVAEIESLEPVKEGSRFDELAARREARISDAEGDAAAGRQ